MNDLQRKREQDALRKYLQAVTWEDRDRLWKEFTRIHAQRDPDEVKKMEKEKGLR